MVDFIRPDAVDEARQVQRIAEVSVVEKKADAIDVRVLVKVIDARGIESGRTADDAVDFVSFFEKQVGEVASVLSRDSCNKGFLHEAVNRKQMARRPPIGQSVSSKTANFIAIARLKAPRAR